MTRRQSLTILLIGCNAKQKFQHLSFVSGETNTYSFKDRCGVLIINADKHYLPAPEDSQ